jgi:hypothetical protein
MTTLRPAGVLGFYILCAAGAVAAAAAPEPPAGTWHFTVLLDGMRIGEHDFAVARHGEETDVVTEAHFRVKAAFLSLYQYDHQDHEVWHNGCLARITSHTRDIGKSFGVQGDLEGDAFEVRGQTIPAQRYSLRAPKLDIDLWYSESGDWIALESKLESGRTLRYEIQ